MLRGTPAAPDTTFDHSVLPRRTRFSSRIMWKPWIVLTPSKRLPRNAAARPDAMISTLWPAARRCSSTTRDRIAWPIPSPVTPYRIFIVRHTTVVRRRVWCETLAYDELAGGSLGALLERRHIDLLLAVRPWQLNDAGAIIRRFQAAGVFVALWPMLADGDGRWASAATHLAFIAFTDELLGRVPFANELVIDLEPPIANLARWKAGRPSWRPSPHPYHRARGALAAAVDRWRATHRITTAVLPLLALELRGQWLQRALGTPTSALAVDRHS